MKKHFPILSLLLLFFSIQVSPQEGSELFKVSKWGATSRGNVWPILNDSSTIAGNASMGDKDGLRKGWATIRGGFNETLHITTDKAVIVKGKVQFVGGGGGDTYAPLRFAITFHANDTLKYALTDSAYWVAGPGWGYAFMPRTGSGIVANGAWGSGTVGVIDSGNWNSTNSNGGPALAAILQAPRNAELIEGTYAFAISVHQVNDTINEIRWNLIEEYNRYWFGGIVTGSAATDKFNAINFGLNTGDFTEFNIIDAEVDLGDPLPSDPICFCPSNYIERWGFFGGKIGGWTFIPGEFVGNTTISGSAPNTDWTAVRGEFPTFYTSPDMPLKIAGNVEFVGGGFGVSASFRIGLFYTDNAGYLLVDTALATLPDSTRWTGTDNNASGYLFIPQSESNGPIAWNGSLGTWGAVVDSVWLSPDCSKNYLLGSELPRFAAGGAGLYNFEISVTPLEDGTSLVKCNMIKDDSNFIWILSAIDNHNPLVTDKFNSIAFALNAGNEITAMNITNVQIDTGTIVKVEQINNVIPNVYALSQNYPNPFNPTTNFEFRIADFGFVTLKVYDILGREIITLINEEKNPGNYTVKFDASKYNLSSGIYMYRLQSGNVSITKKFLLMK